MLTDSFSVRRRTEVLDVHGRMTAPTTETFVGLLGVVTQQDPADIMKREAEVHVPRKIFVASVFAFRGASVSPDGLTHYQPDVIRWPVTAAGADAFGATDYVVEQVLPYGRYGQGVYEVVASSQKAVDVPQ
jgi:hypothetical protein